MSGAIDSGSIASARLLTETEWQRLSSEARDRFPDLAGAGLTADNVLLGYQRRLLETTARNAVTVYEKSRRTGVTWAAGADATLTAATARKSGGMDALYIGYNLDMAREFIDVCAMWARAFALVAADVQEFVFDDVDPSDPGDTRHIQAFRIRFASGFEISALSSKPRSLRGRQGYVIIDEAAFHDDLDALLQAALALLIWGGKVLVISTHYGEDNPFNRLVQDARAGRKPYAVLRTTFDDALLDGLYQRISLVTGKTWSPAAEAAWRKDIIAFYGDGADEELFCVPSEGGGAWLSAALIEACMIDGIPVHRLEMPSSFTFEREDRRVREIASWCDGVLKPSLDACERDDPHALGEDFGRVSDLTVLMPLRRTRLLKRVAPFVVELRNMPFAQQEQIVAYVLDRLPRFHHGKFDATGNGAALAEKMAQRYGPTAIEQVKLSPTWYLENTPRLKAAFEDRSIVLPRDREILDDLRLVRMRGGVPYIPDARTKAAGGKSRHADAAVATMLGYAASEADAFEVGYTPASALHAAARDDDDIPGRGDGRRRTLW